MDTGDRGRHESHRDQVQTTPKTCQNKSLSPRITCFKKDCQIAMNHIIEPTSLSVKTPSDLIVDSLGKVCSVLNARLKASEVVTAVKCGFTSSVIWGLDSAQTTCRLVTKPGYNMLDSLNDAAKLLDNWGKPEPDIEFIKRSPSLGRAEIQAMKLSSPSTPEELQIIEVARCAIAVRKAEIDAERLAFRIAETNLVRKSCRLGN